MRVAGKLTFFFVVVFRLETNIICIYTSLRFVKTPNSCFTLVVLAFTVTPLDTIFNLPFLIFALTVLGLFAFNSFYGSII